MKKIKSLKFILGLIIIPSQALAYRIDAIAPMANIEIVCSIDESDWQSIKNFQSSYDILQERLAKLDSNSIEYKETNNSAIGAKETLDRMLQNMRSRKTGSTLVLTASIHLSRTYTLPNSLFIGEVNDIKIRKMTMTPSTLDENTNLVKVTSKVVQVELSSFAFCPYLSEAKDLQEATQKYFRSIFQ